MKILMVSTLHPYKVAGVVALDLYKGLKEIEGNEVKMLVKVRGKYPDKNIVSFDTFYDYLKAGIIRKYRNGLLKLGLMKNRTIKTNPDYHVHDVDQTITYYSTTKILVRVDFKPDVIIILFMQNFMSFKNIESITFFIPPSFTKQVKTTRTIIVV